MKTVLIVEDEKMIRQGIRTMVQRCGVPIEVIMECPNGEMALEMVKKQDIDVMFTDIRMPKMDGIQLVKEIQKLDKKPEIVAISGYDDFSYAVEMLRNGVREYILKPVERDKIAEIMTKLEAEFKEKEEVLQIDKMFGIAQIRHLIAESEVDEAEMKMFIDKYESEFFRGDFCACVTGKEFTPEGKEKLLFVNNLDEANLCLIDGEMMDTFTQNEIRNISAGVSAKHHGIAEIREAYLEAMEARKVAFYSGLPIAYSTDHKPRIPDNMREQALKQVDEKAFTKRLHLIGTDKTEEISDNWDKLFIELKRGLIDYLAFEDGIRSFLSGIQNLYKKLIHEEEENEIARLNSIYTYTDIDEFEDALMELILHIHRTVNDEPDDTLNKQKVKQALDYIEKNFDKDINMAVVSNEISMNYSLFSFAFKQYTGKNFVTYLRDLRIKKAQELLADTDMKIIDISQVIGYDNEKHFMKVFKSVCGVSPSEYRKNMTNIK